MSSAYSDSSDASLSRQLYLEGQFLGFAPGKKSPFKYLQVMTRDGEVAIKLRKPLQLMLFRYLVIGDWVRVIGQQKWDPEQDAMKLKADEVVRIVAPDVPDDWSSSLGLSAVPEPKDRTNSVKTTTSRHQPHHQPAKAKSPKILICQKSSCTKRGGKAIAKMVERSLSQQGLSNHVKIKYTGCMDRCKAGPNVVFMPDKAKYSRVAPNMIPELVRQHCSEPLDADAANT